MVLVWAVSVRSSPSVGVLSIMDQFPRTTMRVSENGWFLVLLVCLYGVIVIFEMVVLSRKK